MWRMAKTIILDGLKGLGWIEEQGMSGARWDW
jgi:hypothetical protein